MRSRGLCAVLLIGLFAGGCGDDEPAETADSLAERAVDAMKEAQRLFREERVEAARETYRRAYREARRALAKGDSGEMKRPGILTLLSDISGELARWEPGGMMGKAVRYARRAIEEAPEWGPPYRSLALAYQRSGLQSEALNAYDEYHRRVSEDEWLQRARSDYLEAHYLLALDILSSAHVGAEATARRVLEKGFELEPAPVANPDVHRLLSDLNSRYQDAYQAAARAEDGLEIARIHARFGWPGPAADALAKVEGLTGRTLELRWVEARYVEELDVGNPEALESAAKHYQEFLDEGKRVDHALAGYGRVMLLLDRGEEGLAKLDPYGVPTVELRRVNILLRLDRLLRLDTADDEAAKSEYEKILELLQGSLLDWDRALAYWKLGLEMLERGHLDELEEVVRRFRKRFPGDMRTVLLEAELLEKRGVPIEEDGNPPQKERND